MKRVFAVLLLCTSALIAGRVNADEATTQAPAPVYVIVLKSDVEQLLDERAEMVKRINDQAEAIDKLTKFISTGKGCV